MTTNYWTQAPWARGRRRRTRLIAGNLLVITALLGAGCGGSSGSDDDQSGSEDKGSLTFVGFGGDLQTALTKAFLDPFQKETGIKIVQDEPVDYAKLQTQVESGNVQWNVASLGNDYGLGKATEYLEPIDCSIVPCDEIRKGFVSSHRVAVMLFANVLAYRSDKLDGPPPSNLAALFDTKTYPGKRAFDSRVGSSSILEYALIADGVATEDLYPLDLDRALKKLDTIRDDIIWFDSSDQGQQLFSSGEAVIGALANGRIGLLAEEGVPIKGVWSQYALIADYLVIPKGTPDVDAAQRLIAHMTSAENNAKLSQYIAYAPSNELAVDKVDPSRKEFLATTYLDSGEAFRSDDEWWNENLSDVEERFQEWLNS